MTKKEIKKVAFRDMNRSIETGIKYGMARDTDMMRVAYFKLAGQLALLESLKVITYQESNNYIQLISDLIYNIDL